MTIRAHDCDVAVVGGGLAGASAALAFARRGCSVRLFERRDLTRDPNRGDILHPPTVDIARRLGVLERLEERGAGHFRGAQVRDALGSLDLTWPIPETRLLNHAEMETAFLEAAQASGVGIHTDVVNELDPEPGAGWVLNTAGGPTTARFLVGADGAASLTRRTLDIALDAVHAYENGIVVLHTPTPSWLGTDHGWTLLHPEGTIWMLPTTPVGRHRVIISIPSDEAGDWMTSSEEELRRRLADRHRELSALEIDKRGGSHVYRVARTHTVTYSGPRVALSGDAVHTLHPAGGQGLNLAIQDSAKLAELVGPLLADGDPSDDDLAGALDAYEQTRRPINDGALAASHALAMMAGPGRDAYEEAVAFHEKVAADPQFLRRWTQSFGGGE